MSSKRRTRSPKTMECQRRQRAIAHESKAEKVVQRAVAEMGYDYIEQYPVGPYFVDLYVPALDLAIEVNGCYFHPCPVCKREAAYVTYEKERQRLDFIADAGYNIHIVWVHELGPYWLEDV